MNTSHGQQSGGISRRTFLGTLGAGAVAPAAMLGGSRNAYAERLDRLLRARHVVRSDRFGRMFPQLPPFAIPSARLNEALLALGAKGGLMDAKDPLQGDPRRPVLLITDPANSANNPDNPNHPAGTTFLGQFLDHDVTFDLESRLGIRTDPEESPNGRTPMLDLDTVYGGGPSLSPELYGHGNRRVGPKLRIEHGGRFEDVPRTRDGVAIIGDPRNDENMMISGLHAAFIKFHNHVVDLVTKQNPRDDAAEIFSKARRIVTWHYQWIIVHEFLPLIIGQSKVNRLLEKGPEYFRTPVPFIPVEFQGAAYRMGHSMVRPSYRANFNGDVGGNPATNAPAFFGMIFDPAGDGQADPVDLRGFARGRRRFIGWQTFFRFDDVNVRNTKRLDTTISSPLFDLPLATIPGQQLAPTSLPQRNLLRQVTWSLPSGQAIAKEIGAAPLNSTDFQHGVRDLGLDKSTPLWFYILREAFVRHDGLQLGDVGGTIVGEVFVQILKADGNSYLAASPNWRPTLPDRSGKVTGNFAMTDLLTYADVVNRGPGSPQ
ncbi:MAG TPA: heme peroxidase family protein [Gemmatimonadales bacterium]|nr:heme peroxidase family protein [Gemmatimonadales bacterium]